jgi:hypothetical protein
MTKHAAISLVIVAALSSCAIMGQSTARNDGFLVHDAALADPDYLSELDRRRESGAVADRSSMGLFAHRLSPGQGTIVAHRLYSPGGALTIDDEVFEKLTIWFKSSRPESGAIAIDSSVVVVHTKGGSAWPQSACSGIIESGQIRITPKGSDFQVVVTGAIVPTGNRHPAWCAQDSIDISFTASERPLASLTPWLGTAGDHPYEESYPR